MHSPVVSAVVRLWAVQFNNIEQCIDRQNTRCQQMLCWLMNAIFLCEDNCCSVHEQQWRACLQSLQCKLLCLTSWLACEFDCCWMWCCCSAVCDVWPQSLGLSAFAICICMHAYSFIVVESLQPVFGSTFCRTQLVMLWQQLRASQSVRDPKAPATDLSRKFSNPLVVSLAMNALKQKQTLYSVLRFNYAVLNERSRKQSSLL